MLHSGDRLGRLEQRLAQAHVARAVELHAPHVQVHEQHGLDVVAQGDHPHVTQAAHEQPRADEQHDGQGRLHHEQGDPRAGPLERAFSRPGLDIGGDVSAPQLQGRGEPSEEAGDQRRHAGEEQRARVAHHAHLR